MDIVSQHSLSLPNGGTELVPTGPCISPSYFEQEREMIFKKLWLNVGRVDDIPKPGDFFVKEIETLKTEVLVVRGKDNSVRAFHNVCRHRGNKLAQKCSGRANGFSCTFHGWTFDLEGRLVYIPDEQLFPNVDKADFGLLPFTTDVWEGFIFIHADPNPTESLKEFLGEMGDSLTGYPFHEMEMIGRYSATVACNWKVFTDAVEEGFHVPHLHKNSYPEVFKGAGENAGSCHLNSLRMYKYHHSGSVPANVDPKLSPAEALSRKFGMTLIQATAADDLPKGVNPERRPDWSFDINVIFPNFFVDVAKGWYFTYNFWPISVDRTFYETKFYMFPARDAGQRISHEYAKVLFRDVQLEDLSTIEHAQKAIASGVLPYMPLGEQELLLRHKYRVIDEFVNGGRALASTNGAPHA